jgi:hypothetical protein
MQNFQDLSGTARRMLRRQAEKANVVLVVSLTTKSGKEIHQYCENQCIIGKQLDSGRSFSLSRQQLQEIDHRLVEDGYASIYTDFSALDRKQASELDVDEKKAGIKPTEFHLLIVCDDFASKNALNNGHYSRSLQWQFNVEVNAMYLDLSAYRYLVVVENRDSFNTWFQYDTDDTMSPLVVYRGDNRLHTKAVELIIKRWQNEKSEQSLLYFGDLDIKGLSIAMEKPYGGLLLPSIDYIQRYASSAHFPPEQEKFIASVEQQCPTEWSDLLNFLTQKRAGLRQQRMYDTKLSIYSRK